MQSLLIQSQKTLKCTHLKPAKPLWQRAPTKLSDGTNVSDFMMLIPKLKESSPVYQQQVAESIGRVLQSYGKAIVFADLNLKINILWVSVRPIPGICLELAHVIQHVVPEALLVSSQADAMMRYKYHQKKLR